MTTLSDKVPVAPADPFSRDVTGLAVGLRVRGMMASPLEMFSPGASACNPEKVLLGVENLRNDLANARQFLPSQKVVPGLFDRIERDRTWITTLAQTRPAT